MKPILPFTSSVFSKTNTSPKFLLLAMMGLFSSYSIKAQSPITINYTDVPIPLPVYNIDGLTFTAIPTTGVDKTWDYTSAIPNNVAVVSYPPATDPFFTAAGADVTSTTVKRMTIAAPMGTPFLASNIEEQLDLNSTGLYMIGFYEAGGISDLSLIGGSNLDSIGSDPKNYMLTTPVALLKFPMTMSSSWHTKSEAQIDGFLTMNSLGYVHAPFTQKFTIKRSDSVVGWGKMQVYTASGPSIPYEVLMVQLTRYYVDSFFVNGLPANSTVLTTLNINQGYRNGEFNYYDFLRKNDFKYLMRFSYTDTTFTNEKERVVNKENVIPLGLDDVDQNNNASFLYPNPCLGNELNILFMGKNIPQADYQIVDFIGRTMQSGELVSDPSRKMKLTINPTVLNGNYIVQLFDKKGQNIVAQSIWLNR